MPTGVYKRNKSRQSTKDYTCKICGAVSQGWGAHQTHLGQAHDAGPVSPSARKRAVATAKNGGKTKGKIARNTAALKRSLPRIVSAPELGWQRIDMKKLQGASYDQAVPWNLGLVDALNMARKSIERSLEIIEGSQPTK